MSARNGFFFAAILGCWVGASASAQQAIHWQPTLETANRLAGQTNRLVLIHFWADWCKSCTQVEQQVFSRPDVAAALETDFVPVRLNADHFPAKAREYGVSVLPTDIILTPQGQLIDKLAGSPDPYQYLARLRQIAASHRNQVARAYAQEASSPAGKAPSGYYGDLAPQTPGQAKYSDNRSADYYNRRLQAGTSPRGPADQRQTQADRGNPAVVADRSGVPSRGYSAEGSDAGLSSQTRLQPNQPAATPSGYQAPGSSYGGSTGYRPSPPLERQAQGTESPQASGTARSASAIQLPPGSPPLGLDGYCPVQLAQQQRWVPGDTRWGVRHRGRTYLFAGPEQQRCFLAEPDRYAPVLSGNDVVLAVSQGRMVPGHREHGAWYQGRVYLFSSEASFEKFNADPQRYAASIQESGSNLARRPYTAPSGDRSGQAPASPYGNRY